MQRETISIRRPPLARLRVGSERDHLLDRAPVGHVDGLIEVGKGFRLVDTAPLEGDEVRRPEVAARLRQALEFAGDLGDEPDYLDAIRERDELEERIDRLEARLAQAKVLEPARGARRAAAAENAAPPPRELAAGVFWLSRCRRPSD